MNNLEIEPNRALHATMAEPAALSPLKLIKSILAMFASLTPLTILLDDGESVIMSYCDNISDIEGFKGFSVSFVKNVL